MHARRRGVGGRGRRALPRHLRARRLQPGDDDPERAARAQRGSREPPQLAGAQTADPRRRRDPAGGRRATRLPPRVRHSEGDRDPGASLPGRRWSRDGLAQPAIREHGQSAAGRHRVDADATELVRTGAGDLGDRRTSDQQRRRPLPGARGSPPQSGLTADVRRGGDRAEGSDPPVEHLHQPGGANPRVRRGAAARGRSQPPSDGGLHPAGAGFRGSAGRAGPGREDGLVRDVTRRRDQRHAHEGRQGSGVAAWLQGVARAPRLRLGGVVARM